MRRILALAVFAAAMNAQAPRPAPVPPKPTAVKQTSPDTTEFTLFKRKDPIQVGEVGLALRGTDKAHQRFQLDLTIDGQKLELKDMYTRIPLRFYVGTNTQAHELVVIRVADDQIVGRLVSPVH